jgi:predicted nucleic acid-binding protein
VIDTSAMIAALVADHEHHGLARPHLRADVHVAAIVLAETFAQLRRTFRQPAAVAMRMLEPWHRRPDLVLGTSPEATVRVLRRAAELDLGGNIHDALVAQVCRDHGVEMVTLDRRQHAIALALGASSNYLLT